MHSPHNPHPYPGAHRQRLVVAQASPYFQIALYAGGQVLAVVTLLLLWFGWGILAAFQEPLLWAWLCSLSLREVKRYLVTTVRGELMHSSFIVALAKLVFLPAVILWQLFEEVRDKLQAKYHELQDKTSHSSKGGGHGRAGNSTLAAGDSIGRPGAATAAAAGAGARAATTVAARLAAAEAAACGSSTASSDSEAEEPQGHGAGAAAAQQQDAAAAAADAELRAGGKRPSSTSSVGAAGTSGGGAQHQQPQLRQRKAASAAQQQQQQQQQQQEQQQRRQPSSKHQRPPLGPGRPPAPSAAAAAAVAAAAAASKGSRRKGPPAAAASSSRLRMQKPGAPAAAAGAASGSRSLWQRRLRRARHFVRRQLRWWWFCTVELLKFVLSGLLPRQLQPQPPQQPLQQPHLSGPLVAQGNHTAAVAAAAAAAGAPPRLDASLLAAGLLPDGSSRYGPAAAAAAAAAASARPSYAGSYSSSCRSECSLPWTPHPSWQQQQQHMLLLQQQQQQQQMQAQQQPVAAPQQPPPQQGRRRTLPTSCSTPSLQSAAAANGPASLGGRPSAAAGRGPADAASSISRTLTSPVGGDSAAAAAAVASFSGWGPAAAQPPPPPCAPLSRCTSTDSCTGSAAAAAAGPGADVAAAAEGGDPGSSSFAGGAAADSAGSTPFAVSSGSSSLLLPDHLAAAAAAAAAGGGPPAPAALSLQSLPSVPGSSSLPSPLPPPPPHHHHHHHHVGRGAAAAAAAAALASPAGSLTMSAGLGQGFEPPAFVGHHHGPAFDAASLASGTWDATSLALAGLGPPGSMAPGSVLGVPVGLRSTSLGPGGGGNGSGGNGSGSSPSGLLFKWLLRGIVLHEGYRFVQGFLAAEQPVIIPLLLLGGTLAVAGGLPFLLLPANLQPAPTLDRECEAGGTDVLDATADDAAAADRAAAGSGDGAGRGKGRTQELRSPFQAAAGGAAAAAAGATRGKPPSTRPPPPAAAAAPPAARGRGTAGKSKAAPAPPSSAAVAATAAAAVVAATAAVEAAAAALASGGRRLRRLSAAPWGVAVRLLVWADSRARAVCASSFLDAAVSGLIVVGLILGSVVLSAVLLVQVGEESRQAVVSLNSLVRQKGTQAGLTQGVWSLVRQYEGQLVGMTQYVLQETLPGVTQYVEGRASDFLVSHNMSKVLVDWEVVRAALKLPADCGDEARVRLAVQLANSSLAEASLAQQRDSLQQQLAARQQQLSTLAEQLEAAWLRGGSSSDGSSSGSRSGGDDSVLAGGSSGGSDESGGADSGGKASSHRIAREVLLVQGQVKQLQEELQGIAAGHEAASEQLNLAQLRLHNCQPAGSGGRAPAPGGGLVGGPAAHDRAGLVSGVLGSFGSLWAAPGQQPAAADDGGGGTSRQANSRGSPAAATAAAAAGGGAVAVAAAQGQPHHQQQQQQLGHPLGHLSHAKALLAALTRFDFMTAGGEVAALLTQITSGDPEHRQGQQQEQEQEQGQGQGQRGVDGVVVPALQQAQQQQAPVVDEGGMCGMSRPAESDAPEDSLPCAPSSLQHEQQCPVSQGRGGQECTCSLRQQPLNSTALRAGMRSSRPSPAAPLPASAGGSAGPVAAAAGSGSSSSSGGGSSSSSGGGASGTGSSLLAVARGAAYPLINLLRGASSVLVTGLGSTTAVALGTGLGVLRLGLGVAKFLVQLGVFASVLYTLLALDIDPVEQLIKLLPISEASQDRASRAVTSALRGVFVSSLKLAAFHAGFTWLTLRAFGTHFVATATIASAIVAVLPLAPVALVAAPAVLELVLLRGAPVKGLVLLALHLGAYSFGADLIYREIEPTLPYLVGLGVFGGMWHFANPLQGVLLGPMVLALLSVAYNLHRELY